MIVLLRYRGNHEADDGLQASDCTLHAIRVNNTCDAQVASPNTGSPIG